MIKLSILFAVLLVSSLAVVLQAIPLREDKFVYTKDDINLGDSVKWTNCTKAGGPAILESVTFNPDPPQKGKSVHVIATVLLSETVTGGNIKVSLKDGSFPGISQNFDLCKASKCPIPTGTQTVTITDAIPRLAPSGHYTGNVEVKDQNGKELACVDLDMHL